MFASDKERKKEKKINTAECKFLFTKHLPALPRKLDSVNLVPREYFRLYKRPRGIRQKKDWAEMDQVFFDAPFRSE